MDFRELHRAILDFQRTWTESCGQVTPTRYGAILRHDRYPLVPMANLAWVARPPGGGMDEVLDDLDRTFDDAVVRRGIHFEDPQLAFEAQEELVGRGFRPTASVGMARLGLPSCIRNDAVAVREVGPDAPEEDFLGVLRVVVREEGYAAEESRQRLELDRERAAALGVRAFVAYLHDEAAGTFRLWPRGSFALVEDVATHPRFRMQGVGRTMLWEAGRQALYRGAEWTVLLAGLQEAPRIMYTTLGYQPVGEVRGFLRIGSEP